MTETSAAMEGKIVLVTGGIGKATATALAGLGARVIVVGRSRARGETGAADIKTESGNGDVELILADPSSQAEVRRLAGEFEARHDRLDVLVNNVGGVYAERRETPDGIEATLAMNLISPFLLTGLLLPMLERSAPSRVVNVSALGHRFARFDLSDPQSEERYGMMVLTELYESQRNNRGDRPDLFEAAFLARRYRSKFGMVEIPAAVQRFVFPVQVALGRLLGKYKKYAGAPEPVRRWAVTGDAS